MTRADTATPADGHEPELTILLPCLNEAETLVTCIDKARGWLALAGVDGEVLVADNGSTDGSPELADAAGARVVQVPVRGYGAALRRGIDEARGRYVVMADADDSYDLSDLDAFIDQLRDGGELVMGNRFRGGIAPGAMPWLHRYIGNPVLSRIGRLFFRSPIRDFHCGIRGFDRTAIADLGLATDGMEFASEMVVRASLAHLDIREVPTTLRPDGRSRPPHLRTWRDGWRHLRFLLLYSPRWLFFIPGLVLFLLSTIATVVLLIHSVTIGSATFDVAALLYAATGTIIGAQAMGFGVYCRVYAGARGLWGPTRALDRFERAFSLERGLLAGFVVVLAGVVVAIISVNRWSDAGFGQLDPRHQVRTVVPAMLGLVHGSSLVLGSFGLSVLGIKTSPPPRTHREDADG
ncbi:MAG: glycosyl transferase [Ilumatobacteraceae bacterium]|nr:glycosyl transferase [Ilumatobacteraceae bacterium]